VSASRIGCRAGDWKPGRDAIKVRKVLRILAPSGWFWFEQMAAHAPMATGQIGDVVLRMFLLDGRELDHSGPVLFWTYKRRTRPVLRGSDGGCDD
jgi:hypothetical protein